jgi:hypothetical protein
VNLKIPQQDSHDGDENATWIEVTLLAARQDPDHLNLPVDFIIVEFDSGPRQTFSRGALGDSICISILHVLNSVNLHNTMKSINTKYL